MTNQLKPLSLALALVLGTFAAASANAALVSTVTPVAFSGSASVTDIDSGSVATVSNLPLGSTLLSQFDASLGVLTGATVNLVSIRTQTTQVQSTDGPDNGNSGSGSTAGVGSSSARLSIPGGTTDFVAISQVAGCTGSRTSACIGSVLTDALGTNAAVVSTALDSYVGSGAVTVSRSLPTLSAFHRSNSFTGIESTTSTLTWAGTLGVTYTYLQHAVASFSGTDALSVLSLDFGSVLQNSIPSALAFSIFNGSGADRVGLDLDDVSAIGSWSQLYADVSGFSALGAGDSKAFLAQLDTSSIGDYWTSYTFNLSDADVGAASSRNNYAITLNLKGTVVANQQPVNDVPEPGSLALLALGLVGVATVARRRKV